MFLFIVSLAYLIQDIYVLEGYSIKTPLSESNKNFYFLYAGILTPLTF
jgi:hypothetical protein